MDNGVYFDHDGNRFAEKTAWACPRDAFLVRDLNGNGQIDGGAELFGDNTVLSNGKKAANGFEALKDLDTNRDGVIDSRDAAWNELKLWQDKNGNGVVDAGELMTLGEAGIAGLNTGYATQNVTDANGNQHKQAGTYIKTDGTTGQMDDVWFAADPADSKALDLVDVDAAIKALPNVRGSGNLYDFHQAMARDGSGELRRLVEAFVAEKDVTKRFVLAEQMVYVWAGVAGNTAMRGSIEAKKLQALEEFLADAFLQLGTNTNPGPQGAEFLKRSFGLLVEYVHDSLSLQTHYRDLYMQAAAEALTADILGLPIDVDGIVDNLKQLYDCNNPNDRNKITGFIRALSMSGELGARIIDALKAEGEPPRFRVDAADRFDALVGLGLMPTVRRGDGDDVIDAPFEEFIDALTEQNDNPESKKGIYMIGGAGNDTLVGGRGNDVLWGGTGNDYLEGNAGNDIYLFSRGDGHDVILDDRLTTDLRADRRNIIRLGEGIGTDDIELLTKTNSSYMDLIVRIKDTGETITVKLGWQASSSNIGNPCSIQAIEFADGTTWEWADIAKQPIRVLDGSTETKYAVYEGGYLVGSNNNDIMYGHKNDDILYGGAGDDKLYGGAGNDVLWGGAGNDYLEGGAGNDIYMFGRGDGHDVVWDDMHSTDLRADRRNIIRLGEGIGTDDIELLTSPNSSYMDLIVRIKDTGETITVKLGWHANTSNIGNPCSIQAIEFADGTVWEWADIAKQPMRALDGYTATKYAVYEGGYLVGSNNNDIMYGNKNDDILHGGAGDDKLYGNAGNDVLWGGAANDYLEGGAGDDTYLFGRGDGNDTIYENENRANRRNIIRLGEGIGTDDIEFLTNPSSSYMDIIVRIKDTGETLTVKMGCFSNSSNIDNPCSIQAIEFADGTVWEWADIAKQPMRVLDGYTATKYAAYEGGYLVGSNDNDTLYGHKNNDILHGGAGDDKLYGNAGNDTLWGGAGNDYLEGGAGDDIYLFGRGDGNDTIYENENRANRRNIIRLGEGIGTDDIEFLTKPSSSYMDIIVRIKDTGETLTVKMGCFSNSSNIDNPCSIQAIEFADGTVWEWADIAKKPMRVLDGSTATKYAAYEGGYLVGSNDNDTLYGNKNNDILHGGAGDDKLYGRAGNDVLWGGDGNDYLEGGAGDDTYLFNQGDGKDAITDSAGNDKLLFGDGLGADDLWFSKSGYNLIINAGGSADQVTINNWFSGNSYKVESIQAGGMELVSAQMDQLLQALASFGVPQGADGSWTEQQKEALAPVISSYWKPVGA